MSMAEFNRCREDFTRFEEAYQQQAEKLKAEVHLKVRATEIPLWGTYTARIESCITV